MPLLPSPSTPGTDARRSSAAAAACEDALGYCDPAAVEAARDEDVDRQLEAILERGRRSTRQKKRR